MRTPSRFLPALDSLAGRLAGSVLPNCIARLPRRDGFFLTFDDGPDPATTPRLLDRLSFHGAKATFFLLGERASRFPELVRSIYANGHRIGQHGDTHLNAWRAPLSSVIGGMERATAVLEDITGAPIVWMRPPYGRVTPGMIRWTRSRRQRMALWDVMPGDFRAGATPEDLAIRTLRRVRPGSIVVLHEKEDLAELTPNAVDLLLTELASRGMFSEAL